MNDLIIRIVEQGGYWGIAALMVLENVFPPVPSEVVMGIGGVLVARGVMDYWPLLIIGTIGTTVGNYPWYWIGSRWGYERLEPFVARYGRWITLDWRDIEKAAHFFRKQGQWVVFFLRFSPFLRTIVSLPAGLTHMPIVRFLVFTFAGSLVWNALLIEGGKRLAPLMAKYETWSGWVIVGLIAISIVFYVYRVITWKPRESDNAGE